MVDLSPFIIAKSDQLNADDLIGGPITIRITKVSGNNDKEQPISIYFEGDRGKPYKPGKSMRRVLVNFWGKDGEAYVGRRMTLFRDPDVEFGKIKVGGIRISHMSDIGDVTEMALAVTRGAKRLFQVQALPAERPRMTIEQQVDAYVAAINGMSDLASLREYQMDDRRVEWVDRLKAKGGPEYDRVIAANSRRAAELAEPDDDDDISTSAADDDGDDDTFPGGE